MDVTATPDSEVTQIRIDEVQCPDPNDPNIELRNILYLCMMECSVTMGKRIANWSKKTGFPLRPV